MERDMVELNHNVCDWCKLLWVAFVAWLLVLWVSWYDCKNVVIDMCVLDKVSFVVVYGWWWDVLLCEIQWVFGLSLNALTWNVSMIELYARLGVCDTLMNWMPMYVVMMLWWLCVLKCWNVRLWPFGNWMHDFALDANAWLLMLNVCAYVGHECIWYDMHHEYALYESRKPWTVKVGATMDSCVNLAVTFVCPCGVWATKRFQRESAVTVVSLIQRGPKATL